MNVNSDLKQSKYLAKSDVEPPILVTIRDCSQESVGLPGEDEILKWALHFEETDKPMILGPTTGSQIAAILGSDESDQWIGQKIVLYNDKTVMYKGKCTGGIRVRAPKNQAAPAQPNPGRPKPAPAPARKPAPPQVESEPDLSEEPF